MADPGMGGFLGTSVVEGSCLKIGEWLLIHAVVLAKKAIVAVVLFMPFERGD